MKTILLFIGVLVSSVSCAAECSFPREVRIPANWLLEYRGVADTVRYTDESVFLEWDCSNRRLLINGDPYPVPSTTQYSDDRWMAVPRYAELRAQGKSSNEAGHIYEREEKALLKEASEELRSELAHHFTDEMDPDERAAAISNIGVAEKDAALAHVAQFLESHTFVESTSNPTHLNPATCQITVKFHGQPPLPVRLDLIGRYVREEYTRHQACQLAAQLAALEAGRAGVIILQGGGRRTIRGVRAEQYRAVVR